MGKGRGRAWGVKWTYAGSMGVETGRLVVAVAVVGRWLWLLVLWLLTHALNELTVLTTGGPNSGWKGYVRHVE